MGDKSFETDGAQWPAPIGHRLCIGWLGQSARICTHSTRRRASHAPQIPPYTPAPMLTTLITSFAVSLVLTLCVVRMARRRPQLFGDSDLSGPQKFHARVVPR